MRRSLMPSLQVAASLSAAPLSLVTGADPLLAPWSGPYGGVPPFDKVRVQDFKPALLAAMRANLADIDRIANNRVAPDFDHTIAALERSGPTLDRVSRILHIDTSTLIDTNVQAAGAP